MLARLGQLLRRAIAGRSSPLAELSVQDQALVRKVRNERLTYLSEKKLHSIVATVRSIESLGIDGSFIEAGCALGGSTIVISSVKDKARRMMVYDVFGMIPPPTDQDTPDVHDRYRSIVAGESVGIGGDTYYGYTENLYDVVMANCRRLGVEPSDTHLQFVQGLVQDTLHVESEVAFAHIDVDWYEPVMTCLERIYPRLSVGGAIILDDYYDWGGCRKATDEFLARIAGGFEADSAGGSLRITRRK